MFHNFAKSIIQIVPQWIQFSVYHKNEIVLYVYPHHIDKFLLFLKDHMNTQYKVLMDITAVDYPSRNLRFEVVYNILSVQYNSRIRVKTCIDEITPLKSSTSLYSSAGWWEREVWDMFGIFFIGHPDLRRILTDYGFQGHPLRKDFPLTGYTEVRYDDSEKRVITENLELTQEFRYFDFASPWEQIKKSS
jgi:NADH dehydrogenase (ubiquinone) Fe-S protein 3